MEKKHLKCWRMLLVLMAIILPMGVHAQLSALEDGKVYHFTNKSHTNIAMAATGVNQVYGVTANSEQLSQLWYATVTAEYFTLRNLATGTYLKGNGQSSFWGLTADNSASDTHFDLATEGTYNVFKSEAHGGYGYAHYATSQGGGIVGWTTSDASQWAITTVDKTAAEIEQAWIDAAAFVPTDEQINTISTALYNIFSDDACTTLNGSYVSMTDDQLAADANYTALPAELQLAVKKVRDNSWGENNAVAEKEGWNSDYAKKFRVQMYEPYSIAGEITQFLQMYPHNNLDNPTGIFANSMQRIYIMVEGEIAPGAELWVGHINGHGVLNSYNSSSYYELSTGLNIIPYYADGSQLWINYVVHTYNSEGTDDATRFPHKLSAYKPLKIHIEGGHINGYYNAIGDYLADKTSTENLWGNVDNDADWDYYKERVSLTSSDFTVLAHRQTLQFVFGDVIDDEGTTQKGISYHLDSITTPTTPYNKTGYWSDYTGMGLDPSNAKINIMLETWDRIMYSEHATLGLLSTETMNKMNEMYPRWNVDGTTGDIYTYDEAGTDGKTYKEFCNVDYSEYYNHHGVALGSLSGFMSAGQAACNYHYDTMGSIIGEIATGNDIWGPAHEIGHQHQNVFNIRGGTEVTNNVFANAAVWYLGKKTSRNNGSEGSLATVLAEFYEGKPFIEYNIWAMTQMFYKLWLYYHLCGNNTQFYPRFFEMLRRDPLNAKGATATGTESMLKIYKKMCDASGEDLTEFFRLHGFFVLLDNYSKEDYGTTVFTQTQEEVDEAIAYVKGKYGENSNLSILFINDATGNTGLQHNGTDSRALYDNTPTADTGCYLDYTEGSENLSTYTATADEDGTITMSGGTGATGYLILDENGEIIAFSNKNKFKLSDEVMQSFMQGAVTIAQVGKDSEVTVAEADMTAIHKALLETIMNEANDIIALSDDTYTRVGFYMYSAVKGIETALATAQTAIANGTGYGAAYEILKSEIEKFEALDKEDITIPFSAASTYVLKAYGKKTAMTLNASQKVIVNGSADETAAVTRWQFKETATAGTYNIYNTSGYYLPSVSQSATMTATTTEANYGAYTLEYKGNGLYAIRLSPAGNYTNLHADGSNDIVGWNTSAENSQWYLTKVEQSATELNTIKLEELVAQTKELVKKVYFDAPLQTTDASGDYYLSTNSQSTEESNNNGYIKDLLDDDDATYFHSDYSSALPAIPYLQVDLGEGNEISKFNFSYTTRNNGNNCPTEIKVYGRNFDLGDIATATTLNNITTATRIAVKNVSGTNNRFFAGTSNIAEFSESVIFVWEPVNEGIAGSYYLRLESAGENGYIQTGANGAALTMGAKSGAQTFYAVKPTTSGSGVTKFSGETLSPANASENIVRLAAKDDSKWINVAAAGSAPYFANTTQFGGYTVHNIYLIEGDGSVTTEIATYTSTDGSNPLPTIYDSWTSDNIETDKYRFYKFAVTASESSNTYGHFFVMSKFRFTAKANDYITVDEALTTTAYEKIAAAQAVIDADDKTEGQLTTAYSELEAAYEALETALQTIDQTAIEDEKEKLQTLLDETTTLIGKVGTANIQGERAIDLHGKIYAHEPYTIKGTGNSDYSSAENDYNLLDGNTATFFHSNYDSNTISEETYIQVDLGEGNELSNIVFNYTTRDNNNTYPEQIDVYGGTNENGIATYGSTPIATFKSTDDSNPLPEEFDEWTSPKITADAAYRYYKFKVSNIDNGNYFTISGARRHFFVMSEFGMTIPAVYEVSVKAAYTELVSEELLATTQTAANNASSMLEMATTVEQLQAQYDLLLAQKTLLYNAANNTAAIKEQLQEKIDATTELYNKMAVVTDGIASVHSNYTYTAVEAATLQATATELAQAQTVMDSDDATAENIATAINELDVYYQQLLEWENDNADRTALNSKIEELNTLLGTLTTTSDTETAIALQCTNANADYYIWTNAQESTEGAIANIIDDNAGTFFHSNWSSTTPPADGLDHHLTVNLGNNAISSFKFHYQARNGTQLGSYPSTIKVQGSKDGEEYIDLAIIEPKTAEDKTPIEGEEWTSDVIGNGTPYSYLRFMVTATKKYNQDASNAQKDGHVFFHMAEFDLISTGEVSINDAYVSPNFDASLITDAFIEKTEKQVMHDSEHLSAEYNVAAIAELQAIIDALTIAKDYAALPVQLTTDTENPVLYNILINRGGDKLLQYDEASQKVAVADFELGNKYQGWYFTPAADGKANIVPWQANGKMLSTNNYSEGDSKVVATEPATEGYGYDWSIKANGEWYNITIDHTTITDDVTTTTEYYFSNHGGVSQKMGFYNDAGDGGSQFKFELADYSKSDAYCTLYNYHAPLEIVGTGNYISAYSNGEAYNTAYNTATELLEGNNSDDDTYTTAYNTLKSTYEALEKNEIVDGDYYVIRSANPANNLGIIYGATDNMLYCNDSKTTTDASCIWKITKVDGGYNFTNLNTGTSMIKHEEYYTTFSLSNIHNDSQNDDAPSTVELEELGKGQLRIKPGGTWLHAQGDGHIVRWYQGGLDSNSAWYIEPADETAVTRDLTVSKYEWTSLHLGYAVTIPVTVKAYYSTGVDGSDVELVEIADGVIPANTGVLINASEGTYMLRYTTTNVTYDDNALIGCNHDIYVEAANSYTYYVLAIGAADKAALCYIYKEVSFDQEGNMTFTENDDNGTHFKLPAHKVYLPVENATNIRSFGFRVIDGTTGIDGVTDVEGASQSIYDLSGRKLHEITAPGIYIVNGKKVFVNKVK